MGLSIITYPDERLKQESEEISDLDADLVAFIEELEDTMRSGPGAVGIAAPQVGKMIRVAIVDVSGCKGVEGHGRMVMINPEIADWDGMAIGREGCLSVPDYTGNVIRAERVTLEALDQEGKQYRHDLEGFEARAVQHEVDHLDGMLFLDRMVSRRSDLFRRKVFK